MLHVRSGYFSEVHFIGVSEHSGRTRSLVLRLKYARERQVAHELASMVRDALTELNLIPHSCVITWAPTTRERRVRRGFDHAELIARHLGVLLGVRTLRLLRRTTDQAQTGQSRERRLTSPEFIGRGRAAAPAVIVVDDVVTTGSTMRKAAEQLAKDGYQSIVCIAPSRRM